MTCVLQQAHLPMQQKSPELFNPLKISAFQAQRFLNTLIILQNHFYLPMQSDMMSKEKNILNIRQNIIAQIRGFGTHGSASDSRKKLI